MSICTKCHSANNVHTFRFYTVDVHSSSVNGRRGNRTVTTTTTTERITGAEECSVCDSCIKSKRRNDAIGQAAAGLVGGFFVLFLVSSQVLGKNTFNSHVGTIALVEAGIAFVIAGILFVLAMKKEDPFIAAIILKKSKGTAGATTVFVPADPGLYKAGGSRSAVDVLKSKTGLKTGIADTIILQLMTLGLGDALFAAAQTKQQQNDSASRPARNQQDASASGENANLQNAAEDMKEKQNIDILTKNVVDEFSQNNIRGNAADELGKSSDPKAVTALMSAAKNDPAWNVRGRALTALGEITSSNAYLVNRDIFIESLKDSKNYVVECACRVLGRLKAVEAIMPLLEVVRSYREGTDFTAAGAAINTLGQIGDEAVPVLLKELENGPASRGFVLRALAATGSLSALEALKKGMQDTSLPGYEQEYIAKGLARIGTPEAIDSLKKALDTASDDGVVKVIAKCLEDLHVQTDDLEEKKKKAEINAAKKLLSGLQSIRIGMTEDEADDLVGPGNYQMGPNVVHNTRFGEFQLLVNGNRVTGTLHTDRVIESIKKWLEEQK